jgi:hypothetical protein
MTLFQTKLQIEDKEIGYEEFSSMN